jgi:hypothetical protein
MNLIGVATDVPQPRIPIGLFDSGAFVWPDDHALAVQRLRHSRPSRSGFSKPQPRSIAPLQEAQSQLFWASTREADLAANVTELEQIRTSRHWKPISLFCEQLLLAPDVATSRVAAARPEGIAPALTPTHSGLCVALPRQRARGRSSVESVVAFKEPTTERGSGSDR